MDRNQFLERLNSLIEEGLELSNKSLPVRDYEPLYYDIPHFVKCHAWWLSCLNLIQSFFGEEHHFYTNFKNASGKWKKVISKDVAQGISYPEEDMAAAYAVLSYIKNEFELGLVADAKHLYEADLFSNLLDQAFELIQGKYDVGTYAVHGKDEFNKYSKEDILDLLQTIRDKILTIR
jgi:hypothetical protein